MNKKKIKDFRHPKVKFDIEKYVKLITYSRIND